MAPAADNNVQTVFTEYMILDRQRDSGAFSPPELARWSELKRRLNVHFQPDLESRYADRRRSIRVPTRLEIRYESCDSMGESLMTNLSRGGLFIATRNPLAIGSDVELRIYEESGDENHAFDVRAEVTSHHTGADHFGEQFGMGLRFRPVDEYQRKCIDELYEYSVQRAVGLSSS